MFLYRAARFRMTAPLVLAAALGAAGPRPRVEADQWVINAEVECGNAASLERVAAGRIAVAPREDPVPVEVQKTGPIQLRRVLGHHQPRQAAQGSGR